MPVDIAVPTYNRPDILIETLKSIQTQNYPDWYCWIVEDGETKETFQAIQPFLEDKRFQYLPGKHSGSPAHPRNRAILQGSSEYIAFLDDDDIWLPEKLEKQVKFMKDHPDCVLSGCNAYKWSGEGQWDRSLPLYFQKASLKKIPYESLVKHNHFIVSSVMIPRSVLEQSGLFNETFSPPIGEDFELWLRIGTLGEVWTIPEAHMIYRESTHYYYSVPDRRKKYQLAAKIFDAALKGAGGVPSPLTYPENKRYTDICHRERDFRLAGPRFLGELRYNIKLAIKTFFSSRS